MSNLPGCPYPISPLALMFPPLSPARYARLLASIRTRGLIHPIVVWRDQVIDGVHRLKVCLEAGVAPRYEFLDEDEDPFEYLADINIPLRDMTQNEKALTAYLMSQYSTPGRPRTAGTNSAEMRNITQGEAAKLVGVSTRLVSDASRVLSEDSAAVPALQEAVREWRVKCNDAAKFVDRPQEVQERAMELVVSREVKTFKRAVERGRGGDHPSRGGGSLEGHPGAAAGRDHHAAHREGGGPAWPGDGRRRGRRHHPTAPY